MIIQLLSDEPKFKLLLVYINVLVELMNKRTGGHFMSYCNVLLILFPWFQENLERFWINPKNIFIVIPK